MSKTYFVYSDWTLEPISRCFYIGIGSYKRTKTLKRNWSHYNVRKRLGLNRIITLETQDRQLACDEEIKLIGKFHTYIDDKDYNGVGTNLTPGGDHPGEMSFETRKKMSNSRRGSQNHNWGGGDAISYETRQKIRLSKLGKPLSENHKRKLSESHQNPSFETRTKLSVAAKQTAKKGQMAWNKSREKRVDQFDLDGNLIKSFSSIKEVAKQTNTSFAMISFVINGHRNSAKGFIWKLHV